MKFLVETILPTRDRVLRGVGAEDGVRNSRLSTQLQVSVLAMSSSTDWDVSMLSDMMAKRK